MAKTAQALLIRLKAEGLDSITALKSALRGLGKASLTSDKQLESFRKEVIQVAKATKVSQQSIRGQIDAFKGLKQQATVGSTVYRKLGKDIDALTQSLDKLNRTEEESGRKRSPAQIASEFTSAVPEKTLRQLQAQQQMLQKAKVSSDEYTQGLTRINAITQELTRSQQRQVVIANSVVAATKAAAGANVSSKKIDLDRVHTTAALKQKIAELAQDLDNIDVGSKEYTTTSNRLKEAQEELNQVLGISSAAFDELSRAQERAERRAKKLADIQQYYGTSRTGEGQAAQRAGGFRDPATGAMIARGTRAGRVSLVQQPMREISGLYRSIGDIGMAGISADIDRMGKSYQEVARDIKSATLASNGSINSLQAQRSAFAQLRAGLDPTSQDFRELGREIEKVDRRLEKLNKRRRRPTIGGIAQGLGGIAAGGVFGGPEGAFGAAVGGAVGGVAGVAAGAAIGAQVKMMREALGATSEYAAQLQKLEIALKGVAGPEYTKALEAANQVTKDFNVPIDVSTRGITRLSAAVVGAGGNVADAEVVFRNITSAIKATGGGAQDVESAITAMVQTFSKGKVSAEELSGQLGERLPGAVTKFAEANNMTLPELQKSLKAGTVGLDELMKFIISLGPEYEKTAREIADSSADAGAKAAVAFGQVRREVGEALQPIGAQLQKAFSKFILDILPGIKSGAVAAASGLKTLLDASSFLIANFKELLIVAGAAGVALVLQNLLGIAAALGTAFGKATVAMKGFTAASLLNPWVALAAGITAATVALVKHTKKNAEFNKSVVAGETTNEEANDRLRDINGEIKELEERLEKETNNRMIRALTNQLKTARIAAGELELAMRLASSYEVAGVKYDRMSGRPINAPSSYTPHNYDDPDADGGGSGSARVLMTQAELDVRRRIREAQEAGNKIAESQYQLDLDILLAKQETEDAIKRTNDIERANFDFRQRNKDIDREAAEQKEREAEAEARKKDRIEQAKVLAGEITQEEYDRVKTLKEMEVLLEGMPKLYEKIKKKLEELATPLGKFKQGLKEIFQEAMNLNEALATRGVQAVQQFGDAFADFVATGKASFADLTRSILQDLSRIFARAALFKSLSLIPGIGNFLGLGSNGGGGGGPQSAAIQAGWPGNQNYAKGGVFAKNKIVPYAMGGIVNKPTLFQYANGGSGRFGLMGEAGPEAIMPLRRGRGGKLGVEASSGVGNVVVNVDASGSRVQGDQSNAKALGSAIGAAVQAEIVRQKRPGGLLS